MSRKRRTPGDEGADWENIPEAFKAGYEAACALPVPSSVELTVRALHAIIDRESRLRAEQEQRYRAVVDAARAAAQKWKAAEATLNAKGMPIELEKSMKALTAALEEVKDDG